MIETPNSGAMEQIWLGGDYRGPRRATVRATIQRAQMEYYASGGYRSVLFGQTQPHIELPNLKSLRVDARIDTDAATMVLELWNTKPDGYLRTDEYDLPGYYTPTRGEGGLRRWGYDPNSWWQIIAPDRVIRTYEGYGANYNVAPDDDPNLVPTGVWLIDTVEISADLLIRITCRDLAALLLDQIAYPKVVPRELYPLEFESYWNEVIPPTMSMDSVSWDAIPVSHRTNSNYYWDADGTVYGHHGSHAFDLDHSSYWMSIGNAEPDAGYSFEWIEASVPNVEVGGVYIHPWMGNYRVFVSVRSNGVWQGSRVVPYDPGTVGAPNDSNITYSMEATIGHEEAQMFDLKANYPNVDRVRVTFTNLADSNLGTYQYRAGVRTFQVFRRKVVPGTVTDPGRTIKHGNYGDWTTIVKRLCGYGGFYWAAGTPDPELNSSGRIWGDLQLAGTAGPERVPASVFDKKPLMDGVNYVKDILGFVFFIDHTGGVIFRPPNIWSIGNYVVDPYGNSRIRRAWLPVIDEEKTLVEYTAALSNRNKREKIHVGTADGALGATVSGYDPLRGEKPLGMIRHAIWTDQHFATQQECEAMADLLKIRMMHRYRRGSVVAPALPTLQVDDQVAIFERASHETNVHYVAGLSRQWEVGGFYTMQLDTHWLGQRPWDMWVFNPYEPNFLSRYTIEYLKRLGLI